MSVPSIRRKHEEYIVTRQVVGNAVASFLFLAVAFWDFTHDSSGIGAVFVIFAAVYLGLALSGKRQARL